MELFHLCPAKLPNLSKSPQCPMPNRSLKTVKQSKGMTWSPNPSQVEQLCWPTLCRLTVQSQQLKVFNRPQWPQMFPNWQHSEHSISLHGHKVQVYWGWCKLHDSVQWDASSHGLIVVLRKSTHAWEKAVESESKTPTEGGKSMKRSCHAFSFCLMTRKGMKSHGPPVWFWECNCTAAVEQWKHPTKPVEEPRERLDGEQI